MLFAIGDVHGHFDKLMQVMGHCRAYAEFAGDRHAEFVLLGDYVDRGPQSRQVIDFLCAKPENVQAVCGNHEDLMIAALDGGTALMNWLANGGADTLESYRTNGVTDIPASHLSFIANLPTFIEDGLRLFVHAGIDAANPAARVRQTLLWTRKHPPDDAKLPLFVIHGHTPVRTGRPELKPNRLNLDTGAGWGRNLTAAAFPHESHRPLAFLNDTGEVTPVLPENT
jgi:serine/threonine protein phosphatase 1